MAEHDRVELVSATGESLASSTVRIAHRAPGQLHRAFSIVAHDGAGAVLVQRRAAAKLRYPGEWANSCCGHPAPGVEVQVAAAARFRAELGVECPTLTEAGIYQYRAEVPGVPMVEWEYDHVLVTQLDPRLELDPDPAEVAEVMWLPISGWEDGIPGVPTPWLAGVMALATDHFSR